MLVIFKEFLQFLFGKSNTDDIAVILFDKINNNQLEVSLTFRNIIKIIKIVINNFLFDNNQDYQHNDSIDDNHLIQNKLIDSKKHS